jgi:hypothetical protein
MAQGKEIGLGTGLSLFFFTHSGWFIFQDQWASRLSGTTRRNGLAAHPFIFDISLFIGLENGVGFPNYCVL